MLKRGKNEAGTKNGRGQLIAATDGTETRSCWTGWIEYSYDFGCSNRGPWQVLYTDGVWLSYPLLKSRNAVLTGMVQVLSKNFKLVNYPYHLIKCCLVTTDGSQYI